MNSYYFYLKHLYGYCKKSLITGFSIIIALGLSVTSYALPSDNTQNITIKADRYTGNAKTGITVHYGSVEIQQGTLRINADKVTMHYADRRVKKVIAVGRPAQFQQQPAVDKGIVYATAKTLNYSISNRVLKLSDNATLEQDGATMNAHQIDYNIENNTASAIGNANTKKNKQSHMVIPSQK